MNRGIAVIRHLSVLPSLAVLLALVLTESASAQQYLGNARRRCSDAVTVVWQGGSMKVQPFEARSAEVRGGAVNWQCGTQPQGEIACPTDTNKILIDRSQGGSFFSVVCLQK
jgi:hypothetical protein